MTPSFRPDQPTTGPFLDRLFSFVLPGGRRVAVVRFAVLPSNLGILEGGLDPHTNPGQRALILSLAKGDLGDPVVAVEPKIVPLPEISSSERVRERLPWMACMARLTSKPMGFDMASSELTLVWWQDALDAPLPLEIERAAAGVDWENSAQDQDFF